MGKINYAALTHDSKVALVRVAHQARHQAALRIAEEIRPATFLDWGAGDAFLESLLLRKNPNFAPDLLAIYEPQNLIFNNYLQDASRQNLCTFEDMASLKAKLVSLNGLDMIVCLEVLEHMPRIERESFYDFCLEFLSPNGICLISVPVEFGPSLLIKELGRVFWKRRKSEYSALELSKAVFLTSLPRVENRSGPTSDSWVLTHRGFDYRSLRSELEHRFDVTREFATPVGFLPPCFGNQSVFFVLKRKAEFPSTV